LGRGREPDATRFDEGLFRRTEVASPVGRLVLVARGEAICWVGWRDDTRGMPTSRSDGNVPVLARAVLQLEEYFAGRRRSFDVPLAPSGTAFQQRAWAELRRIPFGEVITYGEQARRMGEPRAVRAIGAANGRNPIAIFVPCHRVVGSDRHLTGFAGGLRAKRWLLEREGHLFETERRDPLYLAETGRAAR